MMQLKLLVSHREAVGTVASNRIRKQEIIPGVMTGKCILMKEAKLRKLMCETSNH